MMTAQDPVIGTTDSAAAGDAAHAAEASLAAEPAPAAHSGDVSHADAAPPTDTPIVVDPTARRRKTQAERREEAEQRLLDAALRIVADKGSVRMTLAEVGEAAGYSRGLPAHHFGNKLGLLRELAGHIHHRFQRELRQGPQGLEGLDAIKAMVSVYFGRADEHWTTTRALLVMMTEAFMADSELSECMTDYNRMAVAALEVNIRRGIEQGQIRREIDPSAYAVMILGTLRGVMMQRLIETPQTGESRIDLHEVRDEMMRTIDLILSQPGA